VASIVLLEDFLVDVGSDIGVVERGAVQMRLLVCLRLRVLQLLSSISNQ
jgi:hypothetical protein